MTDTPPRDDPSNRVLVREEAADLLNVSVGYVDSLTLSGEIELTVGSVLAYRERDDAERKAAADEVTRLGQEIEAACDHEWPPMGDLTPNARACAKCGYFEMVVPPVVAPSSGAACSSLGADQPTPAGMFQSLGDYLRRQGELFNAAYGGPPVPFEPGDPAVTPEQVVALLAPQKPGNQPHVGVWQTEPDGQFRIDFRQTDLHYGEGVTSDATRTGREIGIPVCDDDGRKLGEMRLSYANAAVLGAILVDAAEPVETTTIESVDGRRWTSGGEGWIEHRFDKPSAHDRVLAIAAGDGTDEADLDTFRVALTRGERWPLDRLSDDMVDVLYAELASLKARGNPATWDVQATAIVTQAKEIGDLKRAVEETDTERAFQRDLAQKHWAAVRRIREIHRKNDYFKHADECDCPDKHCVADHDRSEIDGDYESYCLLSLARSACAVCTEQDEHHQPRPVDWPCDTVRALDDTPEKK